MEDWPSTAPRSSAARPGAAEPVEARAEKLTQRGRDRQRRRDPVAIQPASRRTSRPSSTSMPTSSSTNSGLPAAVARPGREPAGSPRDAEQLLRERRGVAASSGSSRTVAPPLGSLLESSGRARHTGRPARRECARQRREEVEQSASAQWMSSTRRHAAAAPRAQRSGAYTAAAISSVDACLRPARSPGPRSPRSRRRGACGGARLPRRASARRGCLRPDERPPRSAST